jgi:hypothetical protein
MCVLTTRWTATPCAQRYARSMVCVIANVRRLMLHTILSWLALIGPVAIAAFVAVLVWRKVTRPFLFLCAAILSFLAIQSGVVYFIAGLLPPGEPDTTYLQMGWFAAAIVAVLGCPLLWLLYRGLRHVPGSVQGA